MDKGKIVTKEDARVVLGWLVETIGTCLVAQNFKLCAPPVHALNIAMIQRV